MTFRGTPVATDPSIFSLYTGDSFYMFLQYSGGKFNYLYVFHWLHLPSTPHLIPRSFSPKLKRAYCEIMSSVCGPC